MNARAVFTLMLTLLAGLLPSVTAAHEVRPAYLDIEQTGANRYTIVWKAPAAGEFAIHLVPHMSNGWLDGAPSDQFGAVGVLIKTWNIRDKRADPLAHSTVRIEGLEQ